MPVGLVDDVRDEADCHPPSRAPTEFNSLSGFEALFETEQSFANATNSLGIAIVSRAPHLRTTYQNPSYKIDIRYLEGNFTVVAIKTLRKIFQRKWDVVRIQDTTADLPCLFESGFPIPGLDGLVQRSWIRDYTCYKVSDSLQCCIRCLDISGSVELFSGCVPKDSSLDRIWIRQKPGRPPSDLYEGIRNAVFHHESSGL
ncbi:hypothetical protein PM082_006197 [Marasmius tenuissimus]|nr:hypothetical protein PM082_006197 [Marasmius tenuissimus]